MRGSKKNLQPASGFIPLSSNRPKRPSEIQHPGPPLKKSRHESQEVGSPELVTRVETLLGSGNIAEAEALVVSVLNHIKDKAILASSISGISSAAFTRPGGFSSSRLPPAYTIGMLVIAKHPSGPSLLSRPAVLDQLYSLLTLSIGKSRINISPTGNITSKSRNINAFAANLLWIALKNQTKWPTKLVKLYLEDSISDRAWVDLDECKALVLNIETAFPAVKGDPRGLLQILSTEKIPPVLLSALGIPSSSSLGPGTPQQQQQQSSSVSAAASPMGIAEAVAAANTAIRSSQTAKVIYGEDPTKLVSPRFESNRSAVENLIVTTLRETLSRRSTSGASGLSHGGDVALSNSTANDYFQIRSLLRTIGLAAGIPEVRSLAAQKLEIWFANPKLQVLAAGFFAILTLNCNESTNSLFDIDFIVTVIFRVRQKLFKNTIQASYLDSICRLVEANPNNLDALIKICTASELPTLSSIWESFDLLAKQASKQQPPHLPSSVVSSALNTANQPQARCVAEIVRKLAQASRGSESASFIDLLNTVVQNAIESFGKGQSTVHALLPRLLQHYPEKWTVVLGAVLHDRIIEAVANPNSLSPQIAGPLPPNPSEDELINHTIFLFKPMRKFLRELTNWIRAMAAAPTPSTTQSTGSSITDFLPCAEIGFALLGADRERHPPMQESAEAVVRRMWELSGGQNFGPVTLLRYAYGVTHVVCQLQMISITRAFSNDALVLKKRAEGNADLIKAHHVCIRQIRSYYLRWFRNFLPALFSSISNNASLSDVLGPAVLYIHKCFSRASFLEVASPFDVLSSSSSRTAVFPPFYVAEDVWSTEKNQSTQVYHLTCLPLWEKHALNLLRYGVDLQRVLLDPTDAVSIVCELIWRGTAFACENNSESMNFTKLDDLINLLFKCCYYRSDPDFPSEFADLAHRTYYWKVTMALVALAIHSPNTCGAYFWINFPTVRKLMEMVITNDFTSDGMSVESEYLNIEMDNQLIARLETFLSEQATAEENGRTSIRYSLAGKLVRCNPRGACRRPPDGELASLKQLSSRLRLRRRLCSCRQPDFLLELILSQSTDLPQPWVIQLVESMGQDFTTLPLQCLADYILHAAIKRIRNAEEKDFTAGVLLEDRFDVLSNTDRQSMEGPRRNRLDSTSSTNTEKSASSDDMEMRFLHIMHHLQEQAQSPVPDLAAIAAQLGPEAATAQQFLLNSVVEAVLQSFANRLRDSSSLIRRAARYCLTLLVSKDLPVACAKKSVTAVSNQSTEEFLIVLQSLLSLPGLSVALSSTSQRQPQGSLEFISGSRGMHFLDLILNAILVEDEIAPLTSYIHFLGQLTEVESFEAWHSTTSCLSQLLLNRRTLVQRLLESDDVLSISAPLPPVVEGQPVPPELTEPGEFQHIRGFILLENLCRIMVLNVEYFCTSTKVIPVNENNSVLVVWSQSNQIPMELEVIESNLMFLSRIPRRFIVSNTASSSWWGHLLNIWISDDSSGAHSLPKTLRITQSSEKMGTKLGLISLSASNEFIISPKLRAAFLVSGLSQLHAIALAGITEEDFLQMIVDIPLLLLDSSTATCLVECATRLKITASTAKQKLVLQFIQSKANIEANGSAADFHTNPLLTTSRVFVRPNLIAPPPLLSPKKSFTSPRGIMSPTLSARPPVSPESPTASKNLWRDFFSRLTEAQADFLTQSEAFCSTLLKINSSVAVRNRWMQDLVNVLQTVQTSTKRGRGASASASLTSSPMGDMLRILPNIAAVTFAYSLIRSCLLTGFTMSDTKTVSRYQKAIELSLAAFPKVAFHSGLLERLLLNPLRSALEKKDGSQMDVSSDRPKPFALGLPFNSEALESPLERQMEALTLYGISSIGIESEDAAWSVVRRHILQNQGDTDEANRRSRNFLVEEFVHNTSPTILRGCLRRILQEDVTTLDSGLVLDTIIGILNLPALRSAVSLEEYHSKPDSGNIYSLIHRLTNPHEGMRLIAHVCLEASKHSTLIREKLISTRAPMIDLALQSYPSPLPFMEYLAGFRELPPSNLPSDLTKCHLLIGLNDIARSLLLCTYFRRPGIIYALSRAETRAFLRNPGTSPKCFESREVSRIGGNILTSLSSKFDSVRVFAGPQIVAMAAQHPHLSLRLVPLIASLAQGRFDVSLTSSNNAAGGGSSGDADDVFFNPSAVAGTISWKAFESSKQDNFYLSVLRFMEVLAFSTGSEHNDGVLFSPEAEYFREHIHSILASMIHVMASYYRQLRYNEQFEHRLSALLRAYRRGIGKDCQWSAVSVEELTWLSGRSSLFTGLTSDSPNASSVIPPPSVKNFPHLQASIQKIRNPTSLEEIEHTLLDLEKVTERKPWFLEPFVAELEHRLLKSIRLNFDGHSSKDAKLQPLLFKLFFRYYRSVPQQAPEVLERVYLPCLWSSMNVGAAIDYLPEAAVLAPHLIPLLLHAAASRLVVRSGSAVGCDSIVNAIKGIVFRLPLEGFYQASIDYATGGIQSAISGSKFQKRGLNKT